MMDVLAPTNKIMDPLGCSYPWLGSPLLGMQTYANSFHFPLTTTFLLAENQNNGLSVTLFTYATPTFSPHLSDEDPRKANNEKWLVVFF